MLRRVTFEEWKANRSAVWGSAPFEEITELLAPMHAHLVERLGVGPGEAWLDVATGTGALARLVARAGAAVTGVDFAHALLETARRLTQAEGLQIQFDLGDAEALPYEEASFDVVSSSVGAVFAPDHRAVARELARVCRLGARLGLTAWRPDEGWGFLDEFRPPEPTGAGDPTDWGREEHAAALLESDFELEFAEGDCPLVGESAEAVWELVTRSVGPMRDLVEHLEPERREELRRLEIEHLDAYGGNAGIRRPQAYLLILGWRR
jgi:SAM-dependent methyltransferase